MRCLTRIVLHREVDDRCHKLAVDRRKNYQHNKPLRAVTACYHGLQRDVAQSLSGIIDISLCDVIGCHKYDTTAKAPLIC